MEALSSAAQHGGPGWKGSSCQGRGEYPRCGQGILQPNERGRADLTPPVQTFSQQAGGGKQPTPVALEADFIG